MPSAPVSLHHRSWGSTLLVLALGAVSCGVKVNRLYAGPHLQRDQIALVRGVADFKPERIDGRFVSHALAEIMPGQHTLEIRSHFCTSADAAARYWCLERPQTCSVEFVARAGREYHLLGLHDSEGIWATVQEIESDKVIWGMRWDDGPVVARCLGRKPVLGGASR